MMKSADHVTGLIPPGRLAVTGSATAVSSAFPDQVSGTVVRQVAEPVSYVVDAVVAFGLTVTTPAGTLTVYGVVPAVKVIFDARTLIVAPVEGTPLALKTLVNQIVRPEEIAVPLKFEAFVTGASADASAFDLGPPCSNGCATFSRWQASVNSAAQLARRKHPRVRTAVNDAHTSSATPSVRSIFRSPWRVPLSVQH